MDAAIDRALRRLPAREEQRLLAAILSLEQDPLPDGAKRKKLTGVTPPRYRLREDDWRVIYAIRGQTARVIDLIRRRDLDGWLKRSR